MSQIAQAIRMNCFFFPLQVPTVLYISSEVGIVFLFTSWG